VRFAAIRAWRSKAAAIRLLRRFLEIFGGTWLILEPLALWRPDDLRWGLPGYGGLFVASLVLSVVLSWPRTSITRRLAVSDTKITVKIGDVLAHHGNVIVGVTDVFDTNLGDVIAPRSVQGQFQVRVFPNQDELDNTIARSLAGKDHVVDPAKTQGKNKRYPIGTVVIAKRGDDRYFLSAYSRMGADLQAQSDICKLTNSLEACWTAIRSAGQRNPVHMPVVGSSYARTGLPRSLLVQFIILSFIDEERKASLTSHLHVYIARDDANDIDFVVLENWLADLTRAI
jgi:hypothetical protein